MNRLVEVLEQARLEDPDEPTEAEKIEHEIREELLEQRQSMSSSIPAIALKAILWERQKRLGPLEKWDVFLGEWLLEIDHSRETLELIAKLFKGMSLEGAVNDILA